MRKSRRKFLATASLSLLGAVSVSKTRAQTQEPAGEPPAFGTGPAAGPEVSAQTFAEAEKLVQFPLNESERTQAAGAWRQNLASLYERRAGPRKMRLEPALAPATEWNPVLPGEYSGPGKNEFVRSNSDPGLLPQRDEDIAFAPVAKLSRWIELRKLSSERLTNIYLSRLERFDPKLRCVITLTRDRALSQAKKADDEIAAGNYRGPLHGIPWGAKDLIAVAGIKTTWGAEEFKDQVIDQTATVAKRLEDAGAVLIAKLSLGALAQNDGWFGGRTNNPWNIKEGSSGSSAGPAAATVAGLVGFSLGSETLGSIVSP